MSWNFSMHIDAGGPEPSCLAGCDANYTSNVAPMFDQAFPGSGGVRQLNGMQGFYARELLTTAIARMEANPAEYRAMNPKSGWGDYRSALELLRELRRWCVAAPDARMRAS